MADHRNPQRGKLGRRNGSSSPIFAWLVSLAAIGFALWLLAQAFPGRVTAAGYFYRAELQEFAARFNAALIPIPAQAVAIDANEVSLTMGDGGHYYIYGAINRTPVKFVIDTEASDILLSPADAARAGIDAKSLRFNRSYGTAKGTARGAPITVPRLSAGPILFRDIPVSVNESPMDTSLLGMTFLKRLKSYQVEGSRLVLRWE